MNVLVTKKLTRTICKICDFKYAIYASIDLSRPVLKGSEISFQSPTLSQKHDRNVCHTHL